MSAATLTLVPDVDDDVDADWENWEPPATVDAPDSEAVTPQTEAEAADELLMAERGRWLLGIRKRRARNRAVYLAEVERLEARIAALRVRHEEIDRPLAKREDWLLDMHVYWALVCRRRSNGRQKTSKTLYVTVSTTERQEHWKVTDKAAAIAWAKKQRPDMVKTVTPEPVDVLNDKALLAYVKETSDIVDGVELIPTKSSASVAVVDPDEDGAA